MYVFILGCTGNKIKVKSKTDWKVLWDKRKKSAQQLQELNLSRRVPVSVGHILLIFDD